MSVPRVVVIGDVIDDVIVTPTGPIRPETDTVADIRLVQGGSAANIAAWLASLGVDTVFRGRVGAGDAARHTSALATLGVRAEIDEHPALQTGRIVVLVDGDTRTFLTDGGAARTLGLDAAYDALLAGADAVVVTGHSLLEPARLAQAPGLIARARRAGIRVVFDPSSAGFLADLGADAVLAAVSGVDVLRLNLDEARVLAGAGGAGRPDARDEPAQLAARLTAHAALVVLTLGGGGVVLAAEGAVVGREPAVAAEVVDPTGAGDAFTAGFLAALLMGADPVGAAARGAAVAARAVSIRGGRPA